MDTPSKERLVGAIIFVVLIVLAVPEILSGPHHLASATAPGTNSGANSASGARTYIIDLGNPVKPAAVPASETKPPPLPAPVAAPAPVPPPATAGTTSAPASTQGQSPFTPSAPARTTATATEAWGAQLGSFSSAVNAERLAKTLRGKGYRAFVAPIGTGTQLLYRVRVGPEPTRATAEGLIARLKRDGQRAAVVTFP